jgi:hypothetical protein
VLVTFWIAEVQAYGSRTWSRVPSVPGGLAVPIKGEAYPRPAEAVAYAPGAGGWINSVVSRLPGRSRTGSYAVCYSDLPPRSYAHRTWSVRQGRSSE